MFQNGLSGCYPAPYLTAGQLLELSELCVAHGRIVCTIEAYEMVDDLEYPRFDLCYFADDATRSSPFSDRAMKSHREVQEIIAAAAQVDGRVMFQVWLDW